MNGITTLESGSREPAVAPKSIPPVPALLVLWASDPAHVGEVLLPGAKSPHVFGRGEAQDEDPYDRLLLLRQRPGATRPSSPVLSPSLSRRHLKISRGREGIHVSNLGRRGLLWNGAPVHEITLTAGDTLEIQGEILFAYVLRPPVLASLAYGDAPSGAFGEPDAHGLVGESVDAWWLRDQIAFFGRRKAHVLVTGESGTGKELVAQAMHALSERVARRLVSRNAATLPAGLIDAELFGNVAHYPNPGMPERPGLIGEADGSTLFLDEIGELPAELQTHLLRVLDQRGDYQRLGDARRRTSDFRLIAATNRAIDHLKHDLAARLALRLDVPGLNERREDLPLLLRHLLARTAAGDPAIGERFFEDWDGRAGSPRVSFELVRALYLHRYTAHVRELDALLWRSMSTSRGDRLDLTDAVRAELTTPASAARSEPSADEIVQMLEKCEGMQERAWRELGLASRHVLHRLMKRYGIQGKRDSRPPPAP
ncbi:MAG TPA: sigma 54-interacting transcriptional regulator [Polyangiaceae bacterium]|jgi:two-component system nitrogen regulation response regulator GlnG/two-component system response regulator HydG